MSTQSDIRTWDAWHRDHQPFELGWWKEHLDNYRDDAAFVESWREVKEFIKPRGFILDIGCGPRPPFASCTVIEPLAHEYRKITPPEWWHGVVVYAHPAEYQVEWLRNWADTVICWNCIDHTIGWREILDNMVVYGDARTRYALATDFWPPFLGHPGFEREEFMTEVKKRFEIIDRREPLGRQLALLMKIRS
jgi:hypothetical protein